MRVWRKYYTVHIISNKVMKREFHCDFTPIMVMDFLDRTNTPEGSAAEVTAYSFVKMSDAIVIPDDES